MISMRRRSLVGGLLALLCSLAFAGSAMAGQDIFVNNQWVDVNGLFGPRHSLVRVTANDPYQYHACINALNDGGGWAGTTLCSTGQFSHAYCGCVLRYGWAGADPNYSGGQAFISAWQDW